jgi:hypothetical protein
MTLADIIRELRVETETERPDVDIDPTPYQNRPRETLLYRTGRVEGALAVLQALEEELRREGIDPAAIRRKA